VIRTTQRQFKDFIKKKNKKKNKGNLNTYDGIDEYCDFFFFFFFLRLKKLLLQLAVTECYML